jgi:hypothetical protein
MSDDNNPNKPSFWTTLPGILVGLAGLISAIGGLLALFLKHPRMH